MANTSNRAIWIVLIVIIILFIILGYFALRKEPTTTTPPTSNGGTTTPVTPSNPTPEQTLNKFYCETRKVCQGRAGYANWVKTGTQKKCNASNTSQLLCINDCLGTCYAWQ